MVESADVVFINPPNPGRRWPPIGIGYLQAVLEDKNRTGMDIHTDFIDGAICGGPVTDIARAALVYNPQIIGITAVDQTLQSALELSRELKRESYETFVAMGGIGPTTQPERCLRDGYCDVVVRGEGEEIVTKLFPEILKKNRKAIQKTEGVSYLQGKEFISNGLPGVVYDLDSLPFPLMRDMSPRKEDYLFYSDSLCLRKAPIITSRGCYHGKCGFCTLARIHGGNIYRTRSPENIVDEMKQVHEEYGSELIQDNSPCFLGTDRSWAEKVFDGHKREVEDTYLLFETRADSILRFKDVLENHLGQIYWIQVGMENLDDGWLKRNNKGATKEMNMKATRILQDFSRKRGTEGLRDRVFYCNFFIDCDANSTIEEFKNHYLGLIELDEVKHWTPHYMIYDPYISSAQQEKFWATGNPEATKIRDTINRAFKDDLIYALPSTCARYGKLGEREEQLRKIFDPLVALA